MLRRRSFCFSRETFLATTCMTFLNRVLYVFQVHGGTKAKDIVKKVLEAEKKARENRDEFGDYMDTVLFFDEANTTEAIGLIKEIMCDRSIGGKQLKLCRNLKIVAACNPYRK